MKLVKGNVYNPQNGKQGPVKYLCICGHPVDCELMAIDGIQRGYRAKKYSFANVVTTDGSDFERVGKYENYSDGQIRAVKASEQKKSAEIGRYNALIFLKYTVEELKNPENEEIVNDYFNIIKELKPRIIYTHSLLDVDPANVSVAVKVIAALRRFKKSEQPKLVYGCELTRNLDWVDQKKLVHFDVSKNIRLQKQLVNVHLTELSEYPDLAQAAVGLRFVNATKSESAKTKDSKLVFRALNMTTLIRRKDLSIKRFAMSFVDDIYTQINDAMDRAL